MQFKLNFYPAYFALGLFFLFIAWTISSGVALNYVHFAGELNELGCFVIVGTMGLLCVGASFERQKKSENNQ